MGPKLLFQSQGFCKGPQTDFFHLKVPPLFSLAKNSQGLKRGLPPFLRGTQAPLLAVKKVLFFDKLLIVLPNWVFP